MQTIQKADLQRFIVLVNLCDRNYNLDIVNYYDSSKSGYFKSVLYTNILLKLAPADHTYKHH